MSTIKRTVGFPDGLVYSKFTRSKGSTAAALDEVENIIPDPDRGVLRPGTDAAYSNTMGAVRKVGLGIHEDGSGRWALISLNTSGLTQRFEDRASGSTVVLSVLNADSSFHGQMATFRDASYMANGNSYMQKYVPSNPSGYRDCWAGCPAMLMAPLDNATTASAAYSGVGAPGLTFGHYYYGVTLHYGPNGARGESAIGAVGQVQVPYGQTAVVTVTVPARASTYFPDNEFYRDATGFSIWRTVADDPRDGDYRRIQTVYNLTDRVWVDSVADSDLTGDTKPFTDDPALPPLAQLACMSESVMVVARTPDHPERVLWSEFGQPDRFLVTSSEDMDTGVMAIFPWGGLTFAVTKTSVNSGQVGGGVSLWRKVKTSLGCCAMKSVQVGRNAVYWMSEEGPVWMTGSTPDRIGGGTSDLSRRVYADMMEHGDDWHSCVSALWGEYYILGYPDRRDAVYAYTGSALSPTGQACTRYLLWDQAQGIWTSLKGFWMGPSVRDGKRLLFAEGRLFSRIMAFTDVHTDYDFDSASYKTTKGRVVTGHLGRNDTGRSYIPVRARIVADVQGATGSAVYVRPIVDGVRGTGQKVYAGIGAYGAAVVTTGTTRRQPDEFPCAFLPEHCRTFQLEIGNVDDNGTATATGEFAIHSIEMEGEDGV